MSYTEYATALDTAADSMEADVRLTPDTALRLAVFGSSDESLPAPGQPGARAYVECVAAVECRFGLQGRGIADLSRLPAIAAFRAEAARFRSYTKGCG
ncbi:hypothetical protein [Streptomyces sp. NRRL B-1347]|uniref:hypothetical protein n=1 Tax=Streptomyces sp. NRRL B-1347 TaxID=1476877 RepID=UPI0004C4E5D9|nr:hypothetical protein [Streptomyces sp. NRRL B-1347]